MGIINQLINHNILQYKDPWVPIMFIKLTTSLGWDILVNIKKVKHFKENNITNGKLTEIEYSQGYSINVKESVEEINNLINQDTESKFPYPKQRSVL